MTTDEKPSFPMTYEQFVAVLREWDAFAFIEFSEMSRALRVSTDSQKLALCGHVFPGEADAVRVKLSDLAELLWKSLEAGPEEVDRVHDEHYADRQAEHFKQIYETHEKIVEGLRDTYEELEPPAEMFIKLGKPAQSIVLRDGLLQQAVDNYRQGVEAKQREDAAAVLEQERHRKQQKAIERAFRRLRELDRSQCVFCGKNLHSRLKFVRLSDGAVEELYRSQLCAEGVEEEVLLSCAACVSIVRYKKPGEVDMAMRYGRFSDPVRTQ